MYSFTNAIVVENPKVEFQVMNKGCFPQNNEVEKASPLEWMKESPLCNPCPKKPNTIAQETTITLKGPTIYSGLSPL